MRIYRDRAEAGRLLGRALVEEQLALPGEQGLLILAIPRGGVAVGAEVARILQAPLEVWLSRKIGAPGNPEFAIGSVSSHGETVLDQRTIEALGLSDAYLREAIRRERAELERRMEFFRGPSAGPVPVEGRHVILVDDGAATGSTALAALAALKQGKAGERTLALPVAPLDLVPVLKQAADAVLVLSAEPSFMAVGQFYEDFQPVEDAEAARLLEPWR